MPLGHCIISLPYNSGFIIVPCSSGRSPLPSISPPARVLCLMVLLSCDISCFGPLAFFLLASLQNKKMRKPIAAIPNGIPSPTPIAVAGKDD